MSAQIVSQQKNTRPDDTNKDIKRPLELYTANPSVTETVSDLSDDSYHFMLKESPDKMMFLSSLASLYLIRTTPLFLIPFLYAYMPRTIRSFTSDVNLGYYGIISLFVSTLICIVTGSVGYNFRPLLSVVFKIEVFVSTFTHLALLTYIEKYVPGKVSTTYFEVLLFFGLAIWFSMLGFKVTIRLNASKVKFDFMRNFALCSVATAAGVLFMWFIWKFRRFTVVNFAYGGTLAIPVIFYVCVNSHFVLTYRQMSYFENDSYWTYFSFYTDIFYRFWRDVKRSLFKGKQKKRKAVGVKTASKTGNPKPNKQPVADSKRGPEKDIEL